MHGWPAAFLLGLADHIKDLMAAYERLISLGVAIKLATRLEFQVLAHGCSRQMSTLLGKASNWFRALPQPLLPPQQPAASEAAQ